MATVLEDIRGMTCGGCASNVERALLALDGIESATVDHVAGTADLNSSIWTVEFS
jgi:copper chaperone CopZ